MPRKRKLDVLTVPSNLEIMLGIARVERRTVTIDENKVAVWYTSALGERDARELIGAIPGTLAYGLVRSYAQLPEAAKQVIRARYAEAVAA